MKAVRDVFEGKKEKKRGKSVCLIVGGVGGLGGWITRESEIFLLKGGFFFLSLPPSPPSSPSQKREVSGMESGGGKSSSLTPLTHE